MTLFVLSPLTIAHTGLCLFFYEIDSPQTIIWMPYTWIFVPISEESKAYCLDIYRNRYTVLHAISVTHINAIFTSTTEWTSICSSILMRLNLHFTTRQIQGCSLKHNQMIPRGQTGALYSKQQSELCTSTDDPWFLASNFQSKAKKTFVGFRRNSEFNVFFIMIVSG